MIPPLIAPEPKDVNLSPEERTIELLESIDARLKFIGSRLDIITLIVVVGAIVWVLGLLF